MLHWQLKNLKKLPLLNYFFNNTCNEPKVPNKFTIFIYSSCIIHCLLGLFLFIIPNNHQSHLDTLEVRAHAKNVKIRVIPYGQKKPLLKSNKNTLSHGMTDKKTIKNNSKSSLRATTKKLEPLSSKPTKQNKTEPVAPKKPLTSLKKGILKKTQKNKLESKKSKKQTKKKALQPAIVNKKNKTKELKQKKIEESNNNKVEILKEDTIEILQNKDHVDPITTSEETELISDQDIVYVDYKELESLQLTNALQEAITNVWNPPIGINGDEVECKVCIRLNHEGKLISTTYEHISGIRIYDSTVERALPTIEFPHQLWGKSFTISFKS